MAAARSPLSLLSLAGLLLLLPLLLPEAALAQAKPMCLTQLALANRACAILPVFQANTSSASGVMTVPIAADDGDELGHGHGHGHSHGHRHGHHHRHGRHGHRRGHGYGHVEPLAHKNCCRWLEAMDKACVCDTLLRLPLSLVKPKHSYSISVGNSCKVTFECGGV